MKSKAIICVDDEKSVLSSIKEQLEHNFGDRYIYEGADDATDALLLVDELVKRKVEIILIVSDWLMPGIKGDDLLVQIHKKYPKIVTIMITGHADSKSIENAKKNANLFACIPKPWEEKTLIDTISLALDR